VVLVLVLLCGGDKDGSSKPKVINLCIFFMYFFPLCIFGFTIVDFDLST